MRYPRSGRGVVAILAVLFGNSAAEPQREPSSTVQTASITTIPVVATTHTIFVPETDGFEPAVTTAKVGDFAEWRFEPGKHWVIRGSFDYPCVPFEYFGVGRKGFSSGEREVKEGDADNDKERIFRLKINDSSPIFYYSGQPEACYKDRTMGVINPTADRNLSDWKRKTDELDFQLRPGEPWPSDEEKPTSTGLPDGDKTDGSSLDDPDEGSKSSGGLSPGAIAGIAIGGVATLAILGVLVFYCGRKGGVKISFARSETASEGDQDARQYGSYLSSGSKAPSRPLRTPETADWSSPASFRSDAWRNGSHVLCSHHQRFPNDSPFNTSSHGWSPEGSPRRQTVGSNTACNACSDAYNRRHQTRYQEMGVGNTPVELPTSSDPGNSPLPRYQSGQEKRHFSWDRADYDSLLKSNRI